jgi:DtxR family Mn-dependent transcriptional regulator
MNSFTEENYLKAIFKLSKGKTEVSTNAVAEEMETKASSVTDMLKRLADKKLVNYAPYKGVNLTEEGKKIAISIVRKHRLWEVFLVDKLDFKWDEVHDIAEQLEHIQSAKLVERLDQFLENPKYDPHGDPIPDKDGNIARHKELTLADLNIGDKGVVVGVKEHSKSFLNYLDQMELVLGSEVDVIDKVEFDNSMTLKINEKLGATISNQASKNLYIKKIN